MSYPHRVTVAASIREPVRGKQATRRTIVLDPVVHSRERLGEMLIKELIRRGSREQADGSIERRRGDAVERVDPRTLVATSTIETEETVEGSRLVEVEIEGSRRSRSAQQKSLRAKAERVLRKDLQTGFERGLAARVQKAGLEMERELNDAIGRVYADAVREKAATLGEVGAVREEQIGTELVVEIKVRVSD